MTLASHLKVFGKRKKKQNKNKSRGVVNAAGDADVQPDCPQRPSCGATGWPGWVSWEAEGASAQSPGLLGVSGSGLGLPGRRG